MKSIALLLIALISESIILAQDLNNIQYPDYTKQSVRTEIRIPDIPGYRTLKCDFHMHTIFSDGDVWPTVRVVEAWEEGLDAIAITDHIEDQPSKEHVSGDHNASYRIALPVAEEKNILLIHAGEITRKMPPGHLNALFINDANLLNVNDPAEALKAAKKQGAFIIWNHPGWKAQQPDTCLWMPMHQQLFEEGLINGIEVFNELEFYPIVLDWCISKNLSVIASSDVHNIISHSYDIEKNHRPMTLVFAKERTPESLKVALAEKRSIAWFDGKLAGEEELLTAIFKASVSITPTGKMNSKKRDYYEIKNISSIPFEIESINGDLLRLKPESSIILTLNINEFENIRILNLYTGSESVLKVKYPF